MFKVFAGKVNSTFYDKYDYLKSVGSMNKNKSFVNIGIQKIVFS